MHLVDDEHLVAVPDRRDGQSGNDDLPDVVDAGVAGGVDFEHVDVTPLSNLDARIALAARLGRRPLRTAQRPRQDARRRRLAAPARARKHVRMRDAAARDHVPQRTHVPLLADDVVEPLRAPFSGKNLIRHLDQKARRKESPEKGGSHRDPVHLRHTSGST